MGLDRVRRFSMNKLIKLYQWFVSGSKKLNPVIATLLALVCTAPASAHSPGMDEIIQITTQLAETGEQAALYAKRARIFQNLNMWPGWTHRTPPMIWIVPAYPAWPVSICALWILSTCIYYATTTAPRPR